MKGLTTELRTCSFGHETQSKTFERNRLSSQGTLFVDNENQNTMNVRDVNNSMHVQC